jgi:penicillin-binding protein 1A
MLAVTPQVAYDYLKKLGFTTLVESRKEPDGRVFTDIKPPLALGGITDGVTNLELTAGYAAIANGGVYTKPILYTKIVDHNGKVLLENKPESEQVMKESTAWLLTSAMEDVVNYGTGTNVKLSIDMPIAGKTGSTSDYNDLWFSGFSPYYTATIWSGFDTNRTQTDKTYPRKIWKTIMERIHTELNLDTQTFPMPDSIVKAKICTKSGKLAVDGLCDKYEGGSTVKVEYFAKGTVPTEKCDVHVKATICSESNELATPNCPPNLVKEGVFLNKKETGVTDDTPFVLPSKSCTVHGGQSNNSNPVYEDEPYVPDTIDNTPVDDSLFNDGTTYEDEPDVNTNNNTGNINNPNGNTNVIP